MGSEQHDTEVLGTPAAGGRRAIVQAAACQFHRRGYAEASIDLIAATLGSTKGRIYHYFDSKADLLLEVHDLAVAALRTATLPITVDAEAVERDVAGSLHVAVFAHVQAILRDPEAHGVLARGLDPEMRHGLTPEQDIRLRELEAGREEVEGRYRAVIARGVRSGAFRSLPPVFMLRLVFSVLDGVPHWYRPGERAHGPFDRIGSEQFAEAVATFVVQGLRGRD